MDSPTQADGPLPQNPNPVYMDPIKKQPVHTFASLGKDKTKVSIIGDEGHSYGAILAEFVGQEEARYMHAIMDWPITSKPWSICRSLSKSQFLSPVTSSSLAPISIDCCIVDAMRVVRIKDLKPFTFRS